MAIGIATHKKRDDGIEPTTSMMVSTAIDYVPHHGERREGGSHLVIINNKSCDDDGIRTKKSKSTERTTHKTANQDFLPSNDTATEIYRKEREAFLILAKIDNGMSMSGTHHRGTTTKEKRNASSKLSGQRRAGGNQRNKALTSWWDVSQILGVVGF